MSETTILYIEWRHRHLLKRMVENSSILPTVVDNMYCYNDETTGQLCFYAVDLGKTLMVNNVDELVGWALKEKENYININLECSRKPISS